MTGLRLYVSPEYRPFCVAIRAGKVAEVLPAIRTAYQQRPGAQDLYVIRVQADPTFRREEWRRYRELKGKDAVARFRRGVTLLYLFYEWRSAPPPEETTALIEEATADLEFAWRKDPSVMAGAVLMDAYDVPVPGRARVRAVPFTEEFLRYLDPEHAYDAFQKARASGFSATSGSLPDVSRDRIYAVTGTIGERWSLLNGASKTQQSKEAQVLEKWWRGLGRQLPD